MRVKVVIATKDVDYLERIGRRMNEKFRAKISLTTYSTIHAAVDTVNQLKADVLLIDEEMESELGEIPRRCTYAFLKEDAAIQSIRGIPVVAKYQSVQDIFTDIMNIFLEQLDANNVRLRKDKSTEKTIVTFFPVAGGVGASTIAAAYCIHLADKGQRALYLNLEGFGTSEIFFAGDGKGNFSDVLYAIEMDNSVTKLRIENALKKTERGVLYFAATPSALDMEDLNDDRLERLFEILSESNMFDTIVVDMPFFLEKKYLHQMNRSDAVVYISDGSMTANIKLKRISDAVEALAKQNSELLDCSTLLMYNRFNSKNGKKIVNSIFTEIGGIGRIENASPEELALIISTNSAFEGI